MADRYPLIYNPDANQIQELQPGDSLDAGNASIVNIEDLSVTGVITCQNIDITGAFTGDVTGNLTGNVQAGLVTATTGFNIGIQSGGVSVVSGVVKTINFVGSGNTFTYNSTTKTVDVSISGGTAVGSGVSATGINTGGFWSTPNSINAAISLNNPNHNYGMFGPVALNATVTVGAGNTFTVV
jgi:hypothetical protein